jgi:hypothetical protein
MQYICPQFGVSQTTQLIRHEQIIMGMFGRALLLGSLALLLDQLIMTEEHVRAHI